MGKFKIMGADKHTNNVGAGLLNSASQKMKTTMRKTEFVNLDDIIPNEKNKMSMNNIEELAQLIKMSGLEQPLVVRQREDGKYSLLTGERRYTAIKLLRDRGEWNPDNLVEVKVKDLDDIELPLDDELKEMFSILVTNQNREKTDADIAFEALHWKKIITELRRKGMEIMTIGYDENENPIGKTIKGVPTKDLVAEQLGVSTGQIAKIDKIDNRGTEALKEALFSDRMNIATAASISDMPKKKQDEIIEKVLEKKTPEETITIDDVRKAEHELTHQHIEESESITDSDGIVITEKIFKNDIKGILKQLRSAGGIELDEDTYADYLRKIEALKKLLQF